MVLWVWLTALIPSSLMPVSIARGCFPLPFQLLSIIAHYIPFKPVTCLELTLIALVKRDLGLEAHEVNARFAQDIALSQIAEQLKPWSGFVGAWIEGATLKVAINDKALAVKVTSMGATPVIVVNSLSKLQDAKVALDIKDIGKGKRSIADSGIAAYYVDIITNKLVIEALAESTTHAEAMAVSVGLSTSEFAIKTVDSIPTTIATVHGGDPYIVDNSTARCTIGFVVTTGFITAGHCGSTGGHAYTPSGELLGTIGGCVFPGIADMSYIRTVPGTVLSNLINTYNGGYGGAITGSTVGAVGATVCHASQTSGIHCGTIRALGATVNYSQGRVTGLTMTNVCSDPGDSGSPFFSGTQAQGVTSGGSGNCNTGGITYFQPVNEILSTYGLTLFTG
jgi:hypothetical protein